MNGDNFDGRGYTIGNVTTWNWTGITYKGALFRQCSNDASIKNLVLRNIFANLAGTVRGGTLCGYSFQGNMTFENIRLYDSETVGTQYMGGLLGQSEDTVTFKNILIENYTSDGNHAGGLAGYCSQATIDDVAIHNITILTDSRNGGLCGWGIGVDVNNSYVLDGTIYGNSNGQSGGLFGYLTTGTSIIEDSYVRVNVTGIDTQDLGIIYGQESSLTLVMRDVYFQNESSDITSACGRGNCYNYTELSTTDMKKQSSFSGLDFNTHWGLYEDASYPYLYSEDGQYPPEPNDIVAPEASSYVGGNINIEWEHFEDINLNFDHYDVQLHNLSGFIQNISVGLTGNSTTFNTGTKADGVYEIRVVGFDDTNLSAYSSVSVDFDNTAPSVTISTNKSALTINGTCTEFGSGIDALYTSESDFVNDCSDTSYCLRWTGTTSFDGSLTVYCNDSINNIGQTTKDVTVDILPPSCVGTHHLSTQMGTDLFLQVTCSDDVNLTYFHVDCAQYNFSITETSIQGNYSFNKSFIGINNSFTCTYILGDEFRNETFIQRIDAVDPLADFGIYSFETCPVDDGIASILLLGIIGAFLFGMWVVGELLIKFPIFQIVIGLGIIFFGIALYTCSFFLSTPFILTGLMAIIYELMRT